MATTAKIAKEVKKLAERAAQGRKTPKFAVPACATAASAAAGRAASCASSRCAGSVSGKLALAGEIPGVTKASW